MKRDKIALIIGAGPAGLASAYKFLTETEDIKPIVIKSTEDETLIQLILPIKTY